jgi:hypothetical protein
MGFLRIGRVGGAVHNGGRLQVGLQGFEYYNTPVFPFANLWKCANWPVVVRSAVTYDGSQGPGKSNSPWGLWLDANGDLAAPMDAGITEYRRFWWENNDAGANSLIGRDMVLVFTGTASTVSFDGSPSNISRVGNRVTFTVTTDSTNRVKFSGFTDVNDPPKVTYLCFAEDEAAAIADPYALRPAALDDLRETGILRWMDPMSINSNRATLSVSDIATKEYCKWGGTGREGGLKHGMPLEIMANVCNQLQCHLYFNMPSRIGLAKTGAITSWTRAAPSVVGSYPLPANGDEVVFYKLSGLSRTFTCTADAGTDVFTAGAAHNVVEDQAMLLSGSVPGGTNPNGARTAYYAKNVAATTFQVSTTRGGSVLNLTSNGGTVTVTITPEGDKFTVANVNAGAGTFELSGPGSDTSLLSAISVSDPRNNQWSTRANFTDIRTAMMAVLTALDGYLAPSLKIFLGFANEIFNSGLNFDYFYWARAQARWSWITIDSQSTLHGYMTGILASAANEVFGARRDRWRGVIELHTAGSLASLPFTGLAQAVTDFDPSLTVGDLIDHGAVTTYYAESFGAGANQATLTTWISDSQAANISDPTTYPTQYSHFVERIGTACYDGTGGPPTDSIYITEMPALWDTENGKCITAGITGGLICYEGGCHITGSSLNQTTRDWLEEYFGSQPHADNITQMLALWDAETYTSYPSQFLAHCTKDGNTGSWGVRDQVGVDTPVSAVYAAYNSA